MRPLARSASDYLSLPSNATMPKRRFHSTHPDAAVRGLPGALAVAASVLAAALALAACGGDSDSGSGGDSGAAATVGDGTKLTLVLDFLPNAVHTGVYCALGEGYYEDNNLDLEIIEPSSTADTLRLIEAGEADLGIADGIDVADQISRGRDAKGVMALTQRPLGGLIALQSSDIGEPSDLAGRKVGLTGVPSDSAVLETMVRSSGGDPARVETVTIGFNGVQALLNERIDAFTGFVVADGAQVEAAGSPVSSFGLDEFGGPSYPGLVVFSTQDRIAADPESIGAFVDATVRGYEDTLADPDRCREQLLAANPELEPELQRAQLEGYLPLFQAEAPAYGEFRRTEIEELAGFLVETGLLEERIDPDRFGTNEFVAAATR